MQTIDIQTTVGELVREIPARARVLEAYKIDYCCGGKIPLADACQRQGIDADEVAEKLNALEAVMGSDGEQPVDADAMSLSDLADHIEQTHHAYLKTELPRLDFMTEKVARVHGEHEPRLSQTRKAFEALKAELEPHMVEEEQVLFPIIRELEKAATKPEFDCGSVANPIAQMEHEHDAAGDALAILRESTDDFTPPQWACNTYRAMLDALEYLEGNMHQHVHKENNVLFPKAIALEASL